MIEGGEQLGFALEARHAIRIGREGGRQHLQRDVAVQFRVPRAAHFAHSAGAELRRDLVGADPCSGLSATVLLYSGHVQDGEGVAYAIA